MPNPPYTLTHHTVNAHGTLIRQITVKSPQLVTELHYQKFHDVWVLFKRISYTVQ